MRIAVAIPYVKRVHGNRCAFSVAQALAAHHDTTVYMHTIYPPIEAEVRRQLGAAKLRFLRRSPSPSYRMRTLVALQLTRGRDRELSHVIRADHRERPFDVLLVAASEGQWLAEYARGWGAGRPLTAVWVYDLIDQVFLLGYRRPMPRMRQFLAPLYPILHGIERGRLASFDLLFGLSDWTSQLIAFLYGLPLTSIPAAVDGELFHPIPAIDAGEPYVALPTVSLDPATTRLAQAVKAAGIPLVGFGPNPVPGIPDRGFLSDEEMVQFLSGAMATLFLFDYEAFGLVPFESLACGTPVVTLPQEGPGLELRRNPDVRFGTTASSLTDHCRELLTAGKTGESVARCRASVSQYFPPRIAGQFVRAFEARLDLGRPMS